MDASKSRPNVKTILTSPRKSPMCQGNPDVRMEMIKVLGLDKKPLTCSFCGKTEKEVARLVGGPGVHICDGCIGACNKILEATPSSFAGWDKMMNEQLLDGLKIAEATVEATRAVLQAQIAELRRRNVSWEAIGKALGISRQAAWERFS